MSRPHAAHSPPVVQQGTLLWELRSSETAATVKCIIEAHDRGLCLVRITHGGNEVMSCWYASRDEASSRAAIIQAELLNNGEARWHVVSANPQIE